MDRTKDKMIDDLRSGRVATVEYDEKELEKSFAPFNANNQVKLQSNHKVQTQQPMQQEAIKKAAVSPAVYELSRNKQYANKTVDDFLQDDQQEEEVEQKEQIEQESQAEQELDEQQSEIQRIIDSRPRGKTEIQVQDEIEDESQSQQALQAKQRAKKAKFRFKFISIAICIAIGLMTGLAIYNAVEINTISNQIATNQSEVKVNYVKYIHKISKLDDLKSQDDGRFSTSEIPSTNSIKTYPEEIVETTKIQEKTNWFDKLVDAVRSFFRK